MITSARLFRWSTLATILFAQALFYPATSLGAENKLRSRQDNLQQTNRQISGKRPSTSTANRRTPSMVARAASGSLPNQIPEAPLDGSLVNSQVQQVGFFDGCPNGCGVACDCDSISYGDPNCGLEVSCGVEPGCGFEVGCGVGHALEMLGPTYGPDVCGCGNAGCDGCGEAVCGVETMYGGPACGIESMSCDGGPNCGCDACCGCDVDRIPFFLPLLRIQWCRFEFFAGVDGFKGPMNFANTNAVGSAVRSGSGSFGFYEGFNEGRSLKRLFGWDMSAQLGLRATQSNFSGAEFTDGSRQQIFVTAGMFRRVDYGFQYGTVIDYQNQDWWFQSNLVQMRSEMSWKTQTCHVFGLQTMTSLGGSSSDTFVRQADGTIFTGTVAFEPTDQYRLFYRRLLNGSGDWTAFGGWTENNDGLMGASLNLPLKQKLVLSTSATFLVPDESAINGGFQEEGWNISMGLTYRPGGPKGCGRYCRPMFDVADNGTFLVDQN